MRPRAVRSGSAHVTDLAERFDHIVTDDGLPDSVRGAIEDAGIGVTIA
jgi:DeoR/GlpR family transcriptional regulator of sugar metabolism